MSTDSSILRLVEEALETGRTAEEVCADAPTLISEVRERIARVRRMDAAIEALFPTPGPKSFTNRTDSVRHDGRLPGIPDHNVQQVVGQGGVGIVYRARHLRLNRPVAIKMLLAGAYASRSDRQRFLREAESIAALEHPNIVRLYDYGEVDDRPYFSMELVTGGSLAQKLAGTPQPAREAATTMLTLARAVQFAHDRGIVHRDLKPGNVLIAHDGTPKITDFGLAHRLDSDHSLTLAGNRLGTPSYMAPEQATTRPASIGPATDVYALGAILYELLTGRPPFRAETASETERQVLAQDPAAPSRLNARVPRDLEIICLKCLRKNPGDRYGSAADLAADLARFLNDEPILARPLGRAHRFVRWTRRHPSDAGLMAAALALIVLASVFGVREWNRIVDQRAEQEKWKERLAFIIQMQNEGRFNEGRAILARIPDAGSISLRRRIEAARRDLDVVERLDGIRMGRGRFVPDGGIDYDESARAYETAFRENGLGRLDEAPAIVATRLSESPVRNALVAALDDWAACAMTADRAWVLEVARLMDPDPWRDRVRDQAKWADLSHLADLGASVVVERQPVSIAVAMATRWRRLGGDPRSYLERVQQRHPDDFWVNFELGHLLGADDIAGAVGYTRAALAVRPDSAAAHYNIAVYFGHLERHEEKIYHYQQVVDLDPGHLWARQNLANSLRDVGRVDEAMHHYSLALEQDPASRSTRAGLRTALLMSERADEALALWREMIAESQDDHAIRDGYAELCLFLGRNDEYRRACGELLALFSDSSDPYICERTGRACLLGETSDEDRERATQLIDRALAADASHYEAWAHPYFQFAKALALYRNGDCATALRILDGDAGSVLGPAPKLLEAMAHFRIGQVVAARSALASAIDNYDWSALTVANREWCMYAILRREAEALISSARP